jgi:hypothetical protein
MAKTKVTPQNNALQRRRAEKAEMQQKVRTADSLANVRVMDKMKSDAKKTMSKK